MRVETACRDCKKCMSSSIAHSGRNMGRTVAAVYTLGMSEAVMSAKKKCRGCGHQLSLHGQAGTMPPVAQHAPQVQVVYMQPPAPTGPPPGWYDDPQRVASRRWWDGYQWTGHTQ